MLKQTAIEYLREKLIEDSSLTTFDIFDQAREIEKEMIKNAFLSGVKAATGKDFFIELISQLNK